MYMEYREKPVGDVIVNMDFFSAEMINKEMRKI